MGEERESQEVGGVVSGLETAVGVVGGLVGSQWGPVKANKLETRGGSGESLTCRRVFIFYF